MFFNRRRKVNKLEENIGKDSFINEVESLVENMEIDQAIEKLEDYILTNKKLGKPYTMLMNLYNDKLQIARNENKEDAIQFYLNKIDSLMQTSKDIIRGK
ncbi:MAG: tetratricopeptide repeat protein [Tissierellia bacterium]|nr:tetratricopeptide repeat protein [Tissierellia bacterium]